jgi:hypothetical protein
MNDLVPRQVYIAVSLLGTEAIDAVVLPWPRNYCKSLNAAFHHGPGADPSNSRFATWLPRQLLKVQVLAHPSLSSEFCLEKSQY